ncbi:MAG: hypothetical protein AAF317_16170 [Pseudomonadota bacterium]
MTRPVFDENACLARRSLGAQMLVFGLRACAQGHVRCCCVVQTFEAAFGEMAGGPVLGRILDFAQALKRRGARPVRLAAPNEMGLTHDETSVLAAVSAARAGDDGLRDAHLTWLLGGAPDPALGALTDRLAGDFGLGRLALDEPGVGDESGTCDAPASVREAGHG